MASQVRPGAKPQETDDVSRVLTRQSTTTRIVGSSPATKLVRLGSDGSKTSSTLSSASKEKRDRTERDVTGFEIALGCTFLVLEFCLYTTPKTLFYDPLMNYIVRPISKKFTAQPAEEKDKTGSSAGQPVTEVKAEEAKEAGDVATAVKVKADEGVQTKDAADTDEPITENTVERIGTGDTEIIEHYGNDPAVKAYQARKESDIETPTYDKALAALEASAHDGTDNGIVVKAILNAVLFQCLFEAEDEGDDSVADATFKKRIGASAILKSGDLCKALKTALAAYEEAIADEESGVSVNNRFQEIVDEVTRGNFANYSTPSLFTSEQ